MNLNITIKGGYIFIIDHMCHIFIKMIKIPKKIKTNLFVSHIHSN